MVSRARASAAHPRRRRRDEQPHPRSSWVPEPSRNHSIDHQLTRITQYRWPAPSLDVTAVIAGASRPGHESVLRPRDASRLVAGVAFGDDAAAARGYAIEWPPTDFHDDILGRLGGVFRGTVVKCQVGEGFFVADAFWLPPDGDPIGPMALEVSLRAGAGRRHARARRAERVRGDAALAAVLRSGRRRLGTRARVAEGAARALAARGASPSSHRERRGAPMARRDD